MLWFTFILCKLNALYLTHACVWDSRPVTQGPRVCGNPWIWGISALVWISLVLKICVPMRIFLSFMHQYQYEILHCTIPQWGVLKFATVESQICRFLTYYQTCRRCFASKERKISCTPYKGEDYFISSAFNLFLGKYHVLYYLLNLTFAWFTVFLCILFCSHIGEVFLSGKGPEGSY